MKKIILSVVTGLLLMMSFGIVNAQTYVYLRSNGGEPWGQITNDNAMDAVFGAGNWTTNFFETVNSASMFASAQVIFIDGSQSFTAQMNTWLNNNGTALQIWVSGGGRLFLNVAPNYVAGTYPLGFGGVTYVYNPSFSPTGTAALPTDPIFQGPFTPVGTTWSGNYFAHAILSGGPAALITLITGNYPGTVCEKLFYGNGVVIFGTMTTTNFHSPSPNAANLRQNILSYLKTVQLTPNIQLSVQPKSLNFGFQTSGQFTDRAFLITHSGTQGTLVISQLAISGSPDYSIISPIPPPLTPGQFAQVVVRFSPTRGGVRAASVSVISNGRDSGTQTVTLAGFGSSPNIVVDTTLPLFRGTRVRLGDSATRYIKILSNGQGSVIFNSFILSGIDQDQYFISYYPMNPLPSGQTDSVGITYTPTREGKRTAILTINSNAGNAPSINISLLGTGILPRILITPSVLFFDSTAEGDTSCKQISIQNVGSDTLRLKANFFSSGEGDFTYATLTGKDTIIAPDQTKLINVCFHPLQQGTREARLLFKTNIPLTFETPRRDTSIVTMELRGNGVPLGILANTISGLPILDSEIVGKTICRVDTLRNNGDADITVTSVLFSNPVFAMGARQLPPVPFVLKSRSFMVFDLCGTPALQGINAGTFSVSGTSNTRSIALAPIPLGVFGLNVCVNTPATLFGQVVLPNTGKADSTLCFFVVNCGDIPDTYTAALSGQNKGDYTIISQLPAGPIAPTDTQTICLKYKPSANGPSPASLDITPANAAKTSIVLGGSAGCAVLAAPVVDNIPNTGTFSAQPFKITINNTGTFTWDPGKVIVTGDASFVVDSVTVTGNPPTQVITVYMHFLPTKIGTETAQVSFPNGGPCDSLGAVSLTATSVKGSVAPTTQEGFSLEQTYPNPTQGKVAFTYTTPRECEVKIELVDMTGRVLENLVNGKVSGGEYTVSFDASKYPSGTYLYMLESGSVRLVRQLILAK